MLHFWGSMISLVQTQVNKSLFKYFLMALGSNIGDLKHTHPSLKQAVSPNCKEAFGPKCNIENLKYF